MNSLTSLHCPSKNFLLFFDANSLEIQYSERAHGKRKVAQLKRQQFLSLDSQSKSICPLATFFLAWLVQAYFFLWLILPLFKASLRFWQVRTPFVLCCHLNVRVSQKKDTEQKSNICSPNQLLLLIKWRSTDWLLCSVWEQKLLNKKKAQTDQLFGLQLQGDRLKVYSIDRFFF